MKRKKKFLQSIYDVKAWRGIHVNHLNYTRNLVLTLSVAMLAFATSKYSDLLNQNPRDPTIAVILFGISTFMGLFIATTQSEVFRLYRVISRIIEQTKESPEEEIDESVFETENKKIKIFERRASIVFFYNCGLFSLGLHFLPFRSTS